MIRKKLVIIPSLVFTIFILIIYIIADYLRKNPKCGSFNVIYIIVSVIALITIVLLEMYLVNKYVISKLKTLSDMFSKISNFDLSENIPSKDQDEFTYIETLFNNALYKFISIISFMSEVTEWLHSSSYQLKHTSIKSTKAMKKLDESFVDIGNELACIDNIISSQFASLENIMSKFVNEYCKDKACEKEAKTLVESVHKISNRLSEITIQINMISESSKEQRELSKDVEDISKVVYRLSEKISLNFNKYKL